MSPPPIRQKIKVGSCYLGHFPTSFRRGGAKDFFFLSPSYQYSGDKKSCIFRSPAGTLRLFFIILPSYWGAPEFYFYHAPPVFPLPSGLLLIFFFCSVCVVCRGVAAAYANFGEKLPTPTQMEKKGIRRRERLKDKCFMGHWGYGTKYRVNRIPYFYSGHTGF